MPAPCFRKRAMNGSTTTARPSSAATDVEMLARECQRRISNSWPSVFDVERIAWLEAVGMHALQDRLALGA